MRSILVHERINWTMQTLFLVGALLLSIGSFMFWVLPVVNAIPMLILDLSIPGSAMILTGAMGK
jgi:hypothetical protein